MTPAIESLKKASVPFTVHTYEHDPAAEAFGLEAARKRNVAAERVFKTLVARTDSGELVMGVVPVAERLDPKKLAAAVAARRAEMADPAAAEKATGYVVGGISPLGGRRRLRVVIDASAAGHGTILVSAGRRGLQVERAPADLARVAGASTARITVGAEVGG